MLEDSFLFSVSTAAVFFFRCFYYDGMEEGAVGLEVLLEQRVRRIS